MRPQVTAADGRANGAGAIRVVAPAGDAARRRRCRLFIPLFARLRMSWSDSDEDDRVRTATAHDQSRRRAYRIPTTGLNHVNMDDHINY